MANYIKITTDANKVIMSNGDNVEDALDKKLDKNLSTDFANKILSVDNTGNIIGIDSESEVITINLESNVLNFWEFDTPGIYKIIYTGTSKTIVVALPNGTSDAMDITKVNIPFTTIYINISIAILNPTTYITGHIFNYSMSSANGGISLITKYNKNTDTYTSLYSIVPTKDSVLTKDNIVEYIPEENYHPATKKYVDDKILYVTPEEFGAIGDGITDDTNAIKLTIESGYPIRCQNKYLITSEIVVNKNIDIKGGTFICNGGKIYTYSTDYVSVLNCTVDCTDGQGIYGSEYGFIHAKNVKRVQFKNINISNLPYLYKNDYSIENDDTQFISDDLSFENIVARDCVVVLYASYSKEVSFRNIISLSESASTSATRELFYVIAGIKNIILDNIYSNYSSRFFLHFNSVNSNSTIEVDKTLDVNKIEHLVIANSKFDYDVPMLHLGTCVASIEIINTYSLGCIFESATSAITDYISISNSNCNMHSGESAGNVTNVYYNNCNVRGAIWSNVIPINIELDGCRLISDSTSTILFAIISKNGKLVIKNSTLENTGTTKLQGIQVNGGSLIFENNHVIANQVNRLIANISTEDVIICRNNSIVCDSIGAFMLNTPTIGIITGNYINYVKQDNGDAAEVQISETELDTMLSEVWQ